MLNNGNSSDDDSAPETVSFNAAKSENLDQSQKIKEHISSIRESQKKKRIERQEKYIEQKKTKFEKFKLSADVLDAIGNEEEKNEEKPKEKQSRKSVKNTIKKFSEEDINETSLSDFVPLKTFTNYGISVVSLASTNKKPLIGSDKAKEFKNIMYNRNNIKRQTAQESIAIAKKRKYIK